MSRRLGAVAALGIALLVEPASAFAGERLAFEADGSVYVGDTSSGSAELVEGDAQDPALSPDAGLLAYTRNDHEGAFGRLYVEPAGGGQPQLMREVVSSNVDGHTVAIRTPTYSVAGDRIAYGCEDIYIIASRAAGGAQSSEASGTDACRGTIEEIPAGGGGETSLISTIAEAPEYSTDGDRLLYHSTNDPDGVLSSPVTNQIFDVDLAGSGGGG